MLHKMDFFDSPSISYRVTAGKCDYKLVGPGARIVEHQGRCGIHFTSIHGRAMLTRHGVAEPQGTITAWVLPMQDFSSAVKLPGQDTSNPFMGISPILSDREPVQDIDAANFSWFYRTLPFDGGMFAKFAYGPTKDLTWGTATSRLAGAWDGFEMPRLIWLHLALTWDHPKGVYALWCNGIKVGSHDTSYSKKTRHDVPSPSLYFGNPTLALGDIDFYSTYLEQPKLEKLHLQQAVEKNDAFQKLLRGRYIGEGLGMMPDPPEEKDGWVQAQKLDLSKFENYLEFFHQGCPDAFKWEAEGLRVTTPSMEEYFKNRGTLHESGEDFDMTRVYLWTRKTFEGDVYVSFHFKLHQHGGLALFMARAAGMQGEDFLADYRLRTDGSMRVVCWEDVRNYHWEFYREMADCRNDIVSHFVMKNPWMRAKAYQLENRKWDLERWYRMEFLQTGDRIRGAIDGVTVVDFKDTGFENSGPVLRNGRFAFRAMMRTDMTIGDWHIWTRKDFKSSEANRSDLTSWKSWSKADAT